MSSFLRHVVAFAAVSLVPTPALALSQGKHRDLSTSACWKQKLPSEFCAEVGAAAYNVDHYEWSDLSAHAQPEAGETRCQAANKALGRVRALAQEVRAISDAGGDYDPALAVALGRVLHTLQDNCAHSGMPNEQHAWFSVSDTCTDTKSSPDVQPEAVACAEQETALAFETFAKQVKVPTPPPPQEPGSTSQPAQLWPKRGGVCDFLKSGASWDGVDRRWNNSLVVGALRDQLGSSLGSDPSAPAVDVCAGDEGALEPAAPAPVVDTSAPVEWCNLLKLYCAGKTDGADEAPPWEAVAPAPSSADGAGCGLARDVGTDRAGWLGLALAAFLGRASRVRARTRSPRSR